MFSYFKGNLKQITSGWYTYQIQTDKEVVYIGFGHLAEIYSMQQVACLPGFDKDAEYTVIIHQRCELRFEAVNAVNALINDICKGQMPRLNREMFTTKHKGIRCVETGVVYPSAYKACQLLHIQPPRLSNHLKGRPGHKSIHGLTFEYVNELP